MNDLLRKKLLKTNKIYRPVVASSTLIQYHSLLARDSRKTEHKAVVWILQLRLFDCLDRIMGSVLTVKDRKF